MTDLVVHNDDLVGSSAISSSGNKPGVSRIHSYGRGALGDTYW